MIHDAEADMEIAKLNVEKAQEKWSSLRLQLRDKQLEGKSKILNFILICMQNQHLVRENDDLYV